MPTSSNIEPHVICFDRYEANVDSGELRKEGIALHLRNQSFRVLIALLDRPGQIVTRESLYELLWHGNGIVNYDNNLNAVVAHLREVLNDSADHPRFIETLPGRGYRFIAGAYPMKPIRHEQLTPRPRMIVLPFANLSGDASQEYLSDALTDEIITALVSLAKDRLAVIARTTALRYKGARKDVARIGRELGVEYVVEGSVRLSADSVSVNVQLVRTTDQMHVSAERYESSLTEIFQLQTSIAHDIARHIPALAHGPQEPYSVTKPTANPTAYTEYIKARHEMWKGTPEAMAKAKQHFEAALAHDHRFALACDGLANLHWYLGYWGFIAPDQAEPIRRFYALRAMELDPTLVETRCLTAFRPEKCTYSDAYSYNWAEALEEMARVRDLSPNSPQIRIRYASVLMVLGRTAEAVSELEAALELDPLSVEVCFWLAEGLLFSRNYERALGQAHELYAMEPQHPLSSLVLGHVWLGMKDFDQSAAACRRAAELTHEFPLMLGWEGLALGLGGHTSKARNILNTLKRIARNGYVLPTSFAWVHLGLGEIDEAFKWMEVAVARIDGWIGAIKLFPFLDPLRDDPRFAVLLRKLNLQP